MVDRKRVNKRRVAEALDGVVNVDDEGNFLKDSGFASLNSREKIVVVVLARWVASELGLADDAAVEVEELSNRVGVSEHSVRKYLTDVEFVDAGPRGRGHRVPDERILDAIEYIGEEV
ncbi:hypothetical protein RYH80_00470 [Halobaculum sp. MBLA0147]|uniref:hypothetical protein n=1 Tax=Halobaculum sp. MBLA0147 TaxID=3079934 RepID=UPI003524C561